MYRYDYSYFIFFIQVQQTLLCVFCVLRHPTIVYREASCWVPRHQGYFFLLPPFWRINKGNPKWVAAWNPHHILGTHHQHTRDVRQVGRTRDRQGRDRGGEEERAGRDRETQGERQGKKGEKEKEEIGKKHMEIGRR